MGEDELEYLRWVRLANDPSQSEETRLHYRTQMQAYVHKRMRESFQLATAQMSPPAERTG